MRFSVLLSAAVLSFLFLMPQQGYSQQLTGSAPVIGMGTPPASEQLLHAYREYERLAFYLSDLQRLLNEAKRRGDKNEARRLKSEIKQLQNAFKAAKKDYKKAFELVNLGVQFDFLCATNQNPGTCRKCENGRVVIDDSQSPGTCMKCENGQAVYNNAYVSSCKRCLNGKVVALNGKTCKASTECYEYTCEQGRCVGSLIDYPSPGNPKCLAAK